MLIIPYVFVAQPAKRPREKQAAKEKPVKEAPAKRARAAAPRKASGNAAGEKGFKWDLLNHGGVLFPQDYTPHGVKLKYDKVPVDLTPEQVRSKVRDQ